MLENLIETIKKDFESLKELSDPKQKRKESSLLRQRIDSASKLLPEGSPGLSDLEKIKKALKS